MTDTVPSIKPRKVEPVSPMKILAGLRLKGRKPTQAPTRAAVMTAISRSPMSRAMTSMVKAPMVLTPSARPSRPSMRFTELVTATIQMTVMGTAQMPKLQ